MAATEPFVQTSHSDATGDAPLDQPGLERVGSSSRSLRRSTTTPSSSAPDRVGIRRTASNLVQQSSFRSFISSQHPSFRSVADTFRCPICLENVAESERVVFRNCEDVVHSHCRGCIGQYVRGLIDDGRVNSIRCPHDKCQALASQEEIEMWTDKDTLDKFLRFTAMKQDPELRQCPQSGCEALCSPQHTAAGEIVAEMKCGKCFQEFCYYHSNAHAAGACEDYRLELARAERLQGSVLEGTHPCPSCGITTDKISGCNHMTCPTCRSDWCWICGETLSNIGWHYSPSNPNGCAQFGEGLPPGGSMKCLRICLLPVSIFTLLLLVPCFVIFVLASPLICIAVGCLGDVAVNCCLVIAFLPLIIFQIAWAILCIPAVILMCCCRASQDRILFVVMLPGSTLITCMELGGGEPMPALANFNAGPEEGAEEPEP